MNIQNEQNIGAEDLRYLRLLAEKYPTISEVSAEIVNRNAILNLPKGTEHFISDVHGEFEAFNHVLRNCSGTIREKAIEAFGESCADEELRLTEDGLREFCTLIYYPIAMLGRLRGEGRLNAGYYRIAIIRLIVLCRVVSHKYSHSKIRKGLDPTYAYIVQELLFKTDVAGDRLDYYDEIVNTIVATGASDDFIIKLSATIRRFGIDRLHVVGDIYDRGNGPHLVMDQLMAQHSIDIQWGNHDILWIGAACGNLACIANAVRICLRYANTSILVDGYGVNLLPLTMFALSEYADDPDLAGFLPKITDEIPDMDELLMARMQKAIAVIQFKLEDAACRRNPELGMTGRIILSTYDRATNTVLVNGTQYALNTAYLPTLAGDLADPFALTPEEEKVILSLKSSFISSEKLREHARFLLDRGSMYRIMNNNLLIHAGIPMHEDLTFKPVHFARGAYAGRSLLDRIDAEVRRAYHDSEDEGKDIFWYLWCGPESPLFGKDKMATFERYFIDEKETHHEGYGPFYQNYESADMADRVFAEFGLDRETAHLICGHIPVRYGRGESAIKAGGKIICIDAGFSKAYQPETGQAGCTLTFNSHGMNLIMHEPFTSIEDAVANGTDIISELRFMAPAKERIFIRDTDTGALLQDEIQSLEMLLHAYRNGDIKPVHS
ncbi:MAG: fructose-1,6-bisphosphatase [Clostridiales Family XIII bacterium]|jgi:fructose-1,6-bisphosphatase-3|nr:fructose-1,6-bisphosphatase [Clostridiales Family XIII bacterium]